MPTAVLERKNSVAIMPEDGLLIDHPIIRHYREENSREIRACDCDDWDVCAYEAD